MDMFTSIIMQEVMMHIGLSEQMILSRFSEREILVFV